MKHTFLPETYAGYQVMQWAQRNKFRIIRCVFYNSDRKSDRQGGASVFYI